MTTEGTDFDIVYIDFAKAFDKVDHRMLLDKTHQIDIRRKLKRWVASFILSKTQTLSRIIGVVRGPTLNYGGQLSLYVSYMLRINMTEDLAHLQLSDLQGETRPICRTSDLQEERMLICRT